MATPTYRLIYFPIEGRAELTRLLFRYSGVEFEDYGLPRENWPTLKQDPKIKFGQVPILEISGKPVAQSSAIVRYLSQKFGYLPTDPDAALPIEELYAFITSDLGDKNSTANVIKDPEAQEAYRKDYFENQLPRRLAYLERILEGNTTGFLVGDKITLADFALIDFAQKVLYNKNFGDRAKPTLEKLPNLTGYLQKRFGDPKYKAYLEKKAQQN